MPWRFARSTLCWWHRTTLRMWSKAEECRLPAFALPRVSEQGRREHDWDLFKNTRLECIIRCAFTFSGHTAQCYNASRHISDLWAYLLHAKLWYPRNIQKPVRHFIQGDAFEHLEKEVAKGRIATLLQLGGIKTYCTNMIQHATVLSDVTDASPGYRACCVSRRVLGTPWTFCRILKVSHLEISWLPDWCFHCFQIAPDWMRKKVHFLHAAVSKAVRGDSIQ